MDDGDIARGMDECGPNCVALARVGFLVEKNPLDRPRVDAVATSRKNSCTAAAVFPGSRHSR